MKSYVPAILVGVFLLLQVNVLAQTAPPSTDPLWELFQQPPAEAKVSCYWWWKGKLTDGEVSRQLRLLKAAGFGGAHIIPWSSEPAYLSPEWLKILRTAADTARQEGLILDMSANANWPFRGTWVPKEASLHKVEVETHTVDGPKRFPLPEWKQDAKLAGEKAESSRVLLARLAPEPVISMEQMQDVTDDLTRKDSPGVDVPAGRHTLYVVRVLEGVKKKTEFGYAPDHFDSQAIESYLKGFAERVAPALGGRLGNGLRALYCDSTEISNANWTPDFPEEFKRRCGYDVMPYLPLVLNVDTNSTLSLTDNGTLERTAARVRYDYHRVLVALFHESLGQTFYKWCHDNGTLCRMQAYGWPWHYGIEDGNRIADIPEGNSWLIDPAALKDESQSHGWPVWQKYASSGGHQADRRIISAEAMTVTGGKFTETMDEVKRSGDFSFIAGINHAFLHGFCYSPANEPFPGRNQFGTYFSEQNPWWPYFPSWSKYNARISGLFQASQPVAQVALLFRSSDTMSQTGLDRIPFQLDPPWAHQVWRWVSQNGANADYVSDQILQQAAFKDGQIAFGPMKYDALLVLGAQTLLPETAEALERYARAGGKIVFIGDVPASSPGLANALANDAKVRDICQRLLKEYPDRVMRRDPPGTATIRKEGLPAAWMTQWRTSTSVEACLSWTDQLLKDIRVPRSVDFEKPIEGLYQIHYRVPDGRNLYFFANITQSNLAVRASLPLAGKHLESWDAENGTRNAFPVDKEGRALVQLPPAGALLLVAGKGEPLVKPGLQPSPEPVVLQEVKGPWSATFEPADKKLASFTIEPFSLAGLHRSKDVRLSRFSGRVIYRTRFECDKPVGEVTSLNLGEVANGLSEVVLNGQPLGVRWYGQHDYAAGKVLRQGSNELEITVVTTLFNCLQKPDGHTEPSGLIGPVRLMQSK